MKKKLAALSFTAILVLAAPMSASAAKPVHKCNSGAGNGSELTPYHDCDPGNSGAKNNGGD